MLNELAHFGLNISLVLAVLGSIVPLIGASLRRTDMMQIAPVFAILQFGLVGFAFAALMIAFVGSDFSLRVVVLNSHTLKPMLYKVAGVWGNHEGSLLLWVLILTMCSVLSKESVVIWVLKLTLLKIPSYHCHLERIER